MQKLELRNYLNEVIEKLDSNYFIDIFSQKGISIEQKITHNTLLVKLIDSKASFEVFKRDAEKIQMISYFDNLYVYDSEVFGEIVKELTGYSINRPSALLESSKYIRDFINLHKSILSTYEIIDGLLFQNPDLKESVRIESFEKAEANGFLSFEILSSDDKIEFKSFSIVIENINLLILTVIEIYVKLEDFEVKESPNLILADSGSNTLLSIKLPPEISKTIAKIIDDVWLFLTNHKGYKLRKIDTNLTKGLEIAKKIRMAEKEGIISKERAALWLKNITETSEKIIMNNAITKSKAEDMDKILHRKMLAEVKRKYLTEGGISQKP